MLICHFKTVYKLLKSINDALVHCAVDRLRKGNSDLSFLNGDGYRLWYRVYQGTCRLCHCELVTSGWMKVCWFRIFKENYGFSVKRDISEADRTNCWFCQCTVTVVCLCTSELEINHAVTIASERSTRHTQCRLFSLKIFLAHST